MGRHPSPIECGRWLHHAVRGLKAMSNVLDVNDAPCHHMRSPSSYTFCDCMSHPLNIRKHCIRHHDTHLWNSFTSYLTESKSLNIFKKRYKKLSVELVMNWNILWMDKWCIVVCIDQLYFDLLICINCIHTTKYSCCQEAVPEYYKLTFIILFDLSPC